MSSNVRRKLIFAVKMAIMFSLLAWIGNQVHWRDYESITPGGEVNIRPGLLSCLSSFHPVYYLLAVALQLLTILLAAERWRLLMIVQGISLERRSLYRLSFLGEFFNHFLPGAMGGDLVKAYYIMRYSGKRGAGVVSIFANRFSGLVMMVIVSMFMLCGLLIFGNADSVALKQPVYAVFILGGALGLILFLALNAKLNQSEKFVRLIALLPFSRQLETIRLAMHRHRHVKGLLLPVFFYSLLIVTAFVLSVMMIGLSLEIDLRWFHFFIYLPLILIMTAVPVTPGGVGVMEELFLYFFSTAGDSQKILAMALLYRLSLFLCGLPGGVIFLKADKNTRRGMAEGMAEMEGEVGNLGESQVTKEMV
ncbi:MAG: flippase-like domain-containing protein [Proteobacteria bacterium]|nr:flippase-like domain-containing protein [Pseudomonadota bacterium]MBU1686721.1 flippase-like domain-containing protein [Pseudomonadota bacterium]